MPATLTTALDVYTGDRYDGPTFRLTGLAPLGAKTFAASIARKPGGDVLASFVVAAVEDALDLVVSCHLPAETTAGLPAAPAAAPLVWDLQMIDGASDPVTYVKGTMTVTQDVTPTP